MTRFAIEDEADFVIVGTGAGGATAARVLAAAGCSVAMIEEGVWLPTRTRPRDMAGVMRQAVRSAGAQTTSGAAPIPVLQGRCVGGSTAINSGIIWRMPDDVREQWTRDFGLGELVDEKTLARSYEIIEKDLEIAETSDAILGGNSRMMAKAAQAMDLPGKPMMRNSARCQGSAECLQGCPKEARQSMDVSYVPRAVKDGARVHTRCRAERVEIVGGRAVAVVGDVLDTSLLRPEGRFRIRARRAVIVSAGVVHTPLLLRRTGLRGAVGENFMAHPGAAVVGRFDEAIGMGWGATQGYELPMRTRGFKLESLAMPPELLAARLPGAGAEWQARIAELDHFAQWIVQVRMKARGRIRPSLGGSPIIRFEPLPEDVDRMREAVLLLCRMMFVAGATEVYPGVTPYPEIVRSVDEVDALANVPVARRDFHMLASHLFGTARAGTDPKISVVGPDLRSHAIDGLYVMDASTLPTNMGVNPQHSVMSVIFGAAEKLANRTRAREAA